MLVTASSSTAQVETVIDKIQSVYGRWRRSTPPEQMRRDWDALFFDDSLPCTTEDEMAGSVPVRWLRAPEARDEQVLIYLHGGGFKMGSLASHHDLMVRLSGAAGCAVLGVDYRMLPEFGFPAPLDDALTVYRWLLDRGLSPDQLAIAGDSAGGGLALSTLLAAKQAGHPLPAAAVLLSAWTDLTASSASYETRAAADPIHQKPMILALAAQYLGEGGDPQDPLASPLFGDLSGLPPLLIQVGDRETGLDDSVRLAEQARAAGVAVELDVAEGMIHVYQQFAATLPQARQAIASIGRFLTHHWSIS